MAFTPICKTAELAPNSIISRRLPRAGLVAVARLQESGDIVAFEPRCPHAHGPLAEGNLKGNLIVCPWHFFPFDLRTGKVVGCEGSMMELKRYRVEVVGDDILVDVQQRG